jgi:glycine cleavage system H protein
MTILFFISSIIFFLTVDWIVRRAKKKKVNVSAVQQAVKQSYPLRVPEGIFFAQSHTWLNLFSSGKVHLGIDDFIGRLLDEPEVIFTKNNGDQVQKGEPLLILKESNHLLTVRSPIEGEIVSLNDELSKNPGLLKEKLFSDGWACTIKPQRWAELREFLIGEETRTWMQGEFRRLRDLLVVGDSTITPAMIQDGGLPVVGVMKSMDNRLWKRFEDEFLQVQ